jgi:hypothetical protein
MQTVMTKTNKFLPTILVLAALLPLAACQTPSPPPPQPVAPQLPAAHVKTPEEILSEDTRAAARVSLKEGIDLYTAGDYNASLKRLQDSKEIWATDTDIQLDALKYMAFNYCVTNRATLCKQQFEKALKLNPDFDLLPGEKGHPLWGPVFERARKGK